MKKHYTVPENSTMGFPFSHAVMAGDYIHLSGQPSMNLNNGEFIDGTFEMQFEQCFFNLEKILEAGGLTLTDVVKCNIFLTDMRDYVKMNRLYEEKFQKPYPARSCFGVTGLPMGAKIEIEMIAYRKERKVMKKSETFVLGKHVEITPAGEGVERKVLGYSENMMICEIKLEKGAVIPSHVHPHEQCSTIVSGKVKYTVGAETREVQTGDSVMIGPDVPHDIIALEDTLVIDAFAPMREDFIG